MKIDSSVRALEEAFRLDLERLAGAHAGEVFSNRHTEDFHVFGVCSQVAEPATDYGKVLLRVYVSSWDQESITGDVIWSRSRGEYPLVEEKIEIPGISEGHVARFLEKWPHLCGAFDAALKRRGPRKVQEPSKTWWQFWKKEPNQAPEPTAPSGRGSS